MRRRSHAGITFIEIVTVVLILSVLLFGVGAVINAVWRSYEGVFWQNRVDMEARQALDDICDYMRMAGSDQDLLTPVKMEWQVKPVSTGPSTLAYRDAGGATQTYRVRKNSNGLYYLLRGVGGNAKDYAVSQFVDTVRFEYEYRLPAETTDNVGSTYEYRRVSTPNQDQAHLIQTVYVTVTARYRPQGTYGPEFRRELTSAVNLRRPYSRTVAPAQRILN